MSLRWSTHHVSCTWLTGVLIVAGSYACQESRGQCAIWAPLTNVSRDAGRYAVDGNLAADSAGKVHLIYQSFLGTYGEAFYVTNQSGAWSAPQSLGSLGGKGSAPKIVITPDNALHAFYGKNTLYWRTKPVGAGAWSSPVQVDANPGGGSFIQQVAVDASGGIYFMYGHLFDSSAPARNGIYGRYKPLGGAWAATELIYGNSDDGNWPRGDDIVANGNQLWVSIGVDGNAYFKKKSSPGAWPSGKGTLLASSAASLRFAFNPVSSETAAFYQQDVGCSGACEQSPWYEVFGKYSHDDGATWSASESISDYTNDIDRGPSGVYDANGDLHVVWEGFCCDHKLRMRYRGRTRGVWDTTITQVTNDVGGHIPNSIRCFGTTLFLTCSDSATGIGLYDVVFTSATLAQPRIGVSPTVLSRAAVFGNEVPGDTLSINNTCRATLNYQVSGDATWLSLSPGSGSCTAETDSILVSYPGAAGLPAGTYSASITVTGSANNTPRIIPVQLRIQTVKPDFDEDGDVDLSDFSLFQMCFNGPNRPPAGFASCAATDLNGDGDVDLDDFAGFEACFNGPNHPPTCSN